MLHSFRLWVLFLMLLGPFAQAASFEDILASHEARLGGRIGLAILDTGSGALQTVKGTQRFPMMSTFKTLACATLLAEVDVGRLRLETQVEIRREALLSYSPVTGKFVGQSFSLQQACDATMHTSDNTAANLVLEAIGGPAAVTRFMRGLGDDVTRLDRIEPELNSALADDPRDTSSPVAMVRSLQALLFGDVLRPASRDRLLQWMRGNEVAGPLFRATLPPGWAIADRSGAGDNGSRGITAILWPPQRAPLIVSLYLTGTRADMPELNRSVAEIGREVFAAYRP
ncbi:class A beta-lactamase [Uliginosibacterium sp. 31-12]|uniref:class A beta-lactamase n=1 Tax=Uliginosibacterium sp. 31-12 TaxID=3062781 RepID=UPI0026E1DB13|nr:class A beta-lactamase [Uliginosibacterium sp. 31-12]MDO6386735.1 class A beta-lactamase [Uliginosibacterium sp. 31-12]